MRTPPSLPRPPRPAPRLARRSALGLGVLAVASLLSMATSYDGDSRSPCDGHIDFDPNRPLVLDWGGPWGVPVDTPEFRAGVTITSAAGAAVDFFAREQEGGVVVLCPKGGLAPNTTYTWTVSDFQAQTSTHQADVRSFYESGTWTFRTASTGSWPVIRGADECFLSPEQVDSVYLSCGEPDTGAGTDTGSPTVSP